MLLELAIGDAYGAGFEYADEMINLGYNDLTQYVQHPRHRVEAGCYTDDTQMSIAVAEVIVAKEPWTPLVLANSFVKAFKRDRRQGYASKFYNFLQQIHDGGEFLEKMIPASEKSGAAMRAAPIGIFPTVEQVIEYSTIQAAITHNTANGINAAVAAALMSHYFIYQLGPKRKLGQFLEGYVAGEWSKPWQGMANTTGLSCVRAAITAVMRNDSISKLLTDCIAFTGDVDTVAAIALAAASCSVEIEPDIPSHLIETLENGSYGRDYLINLDKQLMSLT